MPDVSKPHSILARAQEIAREGYALPEDDEIVELAKSYVGLVEQLRKESAAKWSARKRVQDLVEQLEAAQANERHLTNLLDWRTKERDEWRSAAEETLAKIEALNPASRPLDPQFPNHVEGCICPRFKDIAPDLIADLTCPVHGVDGTDPGDKIAERSPASEPVALEPSDYGEGGL